MAASKRKRSRGRRDRQSRVKPPSEAGSPPRPAKRSRGDRPGTAPPSPWGSFPVTELTVLIGIVLILYGFVTSSPAPLVVGLLLGSAAGLELAIREHFAGYRSHTSLLAAVVFMAVTAASAFLAELVVGISLALGAAAAGLAFWLFLRAFRNASGGASYRLR